MAEESSEGDVIAEYEQSLLDLKMNSKPHINMLTMLADENQRYAAKIVQAIENRVQKVRSTEEKLTLLYLIDSIVKNCKKGQYRDCFGKNLPTIFSSVFKNADEKTRRQLHKLRCLWSGVFAGSKLCALDIKVNEIDSQWKILSDGSSKIQENAKSKNQENAKSKNQENAKPVEKPVIAGNGFPVSKVARQQDLLRRLQQKKLELELQKAQEELRLKQKEFVEQQSRAGIFKRKTPSPAARKTPSPQNVPDSSTSKSTSSAHADSSISSAAVSSSNDDVSIVDEIIQPPRKKIKKEPPTVSQSVASVSGVNSRVSTPAPVATPAPSATPGPAATPGIAPTVPLNNRIFVDGRAYEVRFIEDVAVIERNGLPHRVSFIGGAKDVVIDGVAHHLQFSETKNVCVDGKVHTIRFGAPSREIYLDKQPLRGSFGGPPIFVNINGFKHKIQLCGPPPEVKIDPEPCYELARYLRSSHRAQGPVHDYGTSYVTTTHHHYQPTPVARQPLLPTVQLGPVSHQQPTVATQSMFIPQHHQQQLPRVVNVDELLAKIAPVLAPLIRNKSPTPPAASPFRFHENETVQKQGTAPVNLKDFNPSLFKTRYTSVIDALYKKTLQCSTCGLRFVGTQNQNYSKHLDWHFKQNTRDRLTRRLSRPWFYAAEDWVKFEEFGEDTAPKSRSSVFDSITLRRGEQDSSVVTSSTECYIVTENDTQNNCSVCGDKFDQFWDEDEEVWKCRNAVLVNEKAYHPLCYSDVDNGEVEYVPMSSTSESSRIWSILTEPRANSTAESVHSGPTVKEEPKDDYPSTSGFETLSRIIKNEPAD